MQQVHNAEYGKGGFTLVELSVVMALLGILGTIIVSFTALMSGFVSENRAEYDFLEDHAAFKQALTVWVAENDAPNSVFSVTEDGTLIVTENSAEKAVSFAAGILSLGDEQETGFDAIDGITFTANDKLIKCVTYRTGKNSKQIERSFVFSLRSGRIEEVAQYG